MFSGRTPRSFNETLEDLYDYYNRIAIKECVNTVGFHLANHILLFISVCVWVWVCAHACVYVCVCVSVGI